MPAYALIALLWLLFAATHMALSSLALRPRVVGAVGAGPFLGLYSLVAFATFVPVWIVYFAHKHEGAYLFYLGGLPGMRWALYLAMAYAFGLIVAGLVRPSPASITKGTTEVRGTKRLTRHPLLMGLGLIGLFHFLATPIFASDLAFFAGFPLFAVVGCWHQDQRKLATEGPGFRAFYEGTAFLPVPWPGALFAALREDTIAILCGAGLAALIRFLHPSLFGGA